MKGSKLRKRVLAVVLALTMVMSNLTVSAEEVSTTVTSEIEETQEETTKTEESEEEKENTDENSEETDAEDAEEAADETETDTDGESSVEVVSTENESSDEEDEALAASNEVTIDNSKILAFDFGAEELDTSIYCNVLTADVINSWYPGVEAGSNGKNIASFEVKDSDENVILAFNDGGFSTAHRLRTTNTALTRYDSKSLKNSSENLTLNGYIYSNKGSTPGVYVQVSLKKGDVMYAYVASNGNASTIGVSDSNGEELATYTHTAGSSETTKITFYATADGQYRIYSKNEKLVVARVLVEHRDLVTVSGEVSAPSDLSDYSLVFTNKQSGLETTTTVNNGKYSVSLYEGYDYEISLKDANGYVITSSDSLSLASENATLNITISSVKLATIEGSIVGYDEALLDELEILFLSDEIYTPTVTIDGTSYSALLETGVEYTVTFKGSADYQLTTPATVNISENTTQNITFVKKPTYKVTINPVGAGLSDLAAATFTFTRHSDNDVTAEEDYVYTFTGTDNIELRDGVYTVKVTNSGAYVQQLTSNLTVNGEAVTKTINFESDITSWTFTDSDFANGGYTDTTATYTYNNLIFTGGKSHQATYLYMGTGSVKVPVSNACQVKVSACYQYSFYFENEAESSVNVKTGSTSQIDTFTYDYTGEAGTVDITFLGTSYVTKIEVVEVNEYKETVTVGASGCDYTTINDALAAVRKMDRTSDQRVTIEIQPGNYEEMLVIDVDNVSLVNAAGDDASIALTNKGVDIADNAVRITWYYGHGYTYYSMGSDCKYDAELLTVNKENGYPSFTNPGAGTTSGSYWNATVVITASGFEAEGIIFENSFNQYVSQKAAEDVLVAQSGAKEGTVARASMKAGDTTVQNKKYVERAAALAIANNCTEIFFDNCKFIGRQDTLYGGTGVTAGFQKCAILGGTDYIFGGMTAVFAKCDLVANTMEDTNDNFYITAAQQKSGRGYLMYNCTVTSTTPGVDTASEEVSKAGYLGRPWQANTAEVVFYATNIGTANDGTSLITPAGWLSTLSGTSDNVYEIASNEVTEGVDNSASRVSWAKTYTTTEGVTLSDGSEITFATFLGNWNPFDDGMETIETKTADEVNPSVKEDSDEYSCTTYTLDATADFKDATFSKGTKEEGDSQKAGTDNYFTLIYSAKSAVDSSNKSWDDGYSATQRINFGGAVSTEKNAVKFTTKGTGVVKVWWVEGGDDNRQMAILGSDGTQVAVTSETLKRNATCISTFTLDTAGTYYLGGETNNNYIFKVEVTDTVGDAGESTVTKTEWSKVTAPEVTAVSLNADSTGSIDVTVKMLIDEGIDGAEKVTVYMKDEDGNTTTKSSIKAGEEQTYTFTPSASGTYKFYAEASRSDEEAVLTSATKSFDFTLPLEAPSIKSATSKGDGKVEVAWDAVDEATSYIVCVDGEEVKETSELSYVVTGLEISKEYTFGVKAVRKEKTLLAFTISKEVSEIGTTKTITVVDEEQRTWVFSAFGQGTNSTNNDYVGDINDGSVTVYSENGKGKIVPGSTDGLAFYYTAIDPDTENFTLTADVYVDSWTFSNGQEGFGIMAADAVGPNGYGTNFWNNSYQVLASKIEYYYDSTKGAITTDTSATKITMKLGLGYNTRLGVTADDVASFNLTGGFNKADGTTASIPEGFTTETGTLETYGATDSSIRNIVGNATKAVDNTMNPAITTFKLQLQRNNTGYYLRYLDADGNVINEKMYYDIDRTALTQIDEDNIYVGFFASRNARITVSNVTFTVIDPADDDAAETREIEYVYPSYTIESSEYANSADYDLVYYGNADGKVTIVSSNGTTVCEDALVKASTKYTFPTTISAGTTTFTVTVTPDEDYAPGEYQLLTTYEPQTFTHTVTFNSFNGDYIYVSPTGSSTAAGTSSNPVDIYTAVKYAQAGQTIVLKAGTYSLTKTVTVDRGINGTVDAPIYMISDPNSSDRAVFDFNAACAGMVLAGDYWYFSGFDVTNSANGQKGVQVSGNHNTLDQVNAYKNGNTGIQISRYKGTDEYDQWPSYNLILNCTSYLNADAGYEDADGFSAKLTVADGNVFDGCISAYNADDGWDLFAKAQTGSIGSVTIQNCVAFMNGYVLKNEDGELDLNGSLVDAGNGNGFKMGGDSMPGAHVLKNSVAFMNKAKGIDSNSCPDIKVYSSTSFDNEKANVAFYTNTAVNTAYYADGILSYKVSNDEVENIKAKGTQVTTDIYGTTNFYTTAKKTSANSEGTAVAESWFKSLERDTSVGLFGISRNEDGTINMNGFLELTDEAPKGVGARMSGLASNNDFTAPEFTESTNSSSSSSSSSESSSSSSSTSSTTESVATPIRVMIAADVELQEINGLPVFSYKLSSDSYLKMKLFEAYHGIDGYLMLSLATNVGVSIKTANTQKVTRDVDFKVTMTKTDKNMIEGYNSFKLSPRTMGEIGYEVTLHLNLGSQYIGKRAYFFSHNKEDNSYTLVGSMLVNEIGNVCIDTNKMNEMVILVPKN